MFPSLDPGEEASRHQAAYRLIMNHDAVVNFALRGAGSPGAKRFQVSDSPHFHLVLCRIIVL